MFAVASDVYVDKLPSANGGTNIMFWEHLIVHFFWFWAVWRQFVQLSLGQHCVPDLVNQLLAVLC